MKGKTLLLPVALFALASPAFAADKNPTDYPIKLTILETHTDTNRWGVHGSGRGRINLDGQVNGIEFQYDCSEKYGVAYGGEYLLARWKRQPSELTVLSHGMGDSHMNTCDMKVSVHDFIYVTKDGHLATISQKEWAMKHKRGGKHQDDEDAPPAQ